MLEFLTQTVVATPAPTPTVTPLPTPTSTDINIYAQELFKQVLGIDVVSALKLVGFWLALIWLVFALWVAFDAMSRYKQRYIGFLWFLFVLPFNIFGFIGYLFMRPVVTLEEKQWTKLESKYLMYELSSVNDCPTCKTLVPVNSNFCPVCGTQMNINCPKCESVQSIYNVFCASCGQRLIPVEAMNEPHHRGHKHPVHEAQEEQVETKKAGLFTHLSGVVSNATKSVATKVKRAADKATGKKVAPVMVVPPEVHEESAHSKEES